MHVQTTHQQRTAMAIPPEKYFTATAYGMVGTGRSPSEAKRDLMEKIRQAGEA